MLPQHGRVAEELGLPPTAIEVSASKSNANRPLPAPPEHLGGGTSNKHCTICLFYQYKEPSWTTREHKAALNKVQQLAKQYAITGRGRCAPEGLNCTLTASANDSEFIACSNVIGLSYIPSTHIICIHCFLPVILSSCILLRVTCLGSRLIQPNRLQVGRWRG